MILSDYINKQRFIIGYSNDPEILSLKLFEELSEMYHEEIISRINKKASPNLANEVADVIIVAYALHDINKCNGIIVNSNLSILLDTIIGEVAKIASLYSIDVYKAVVNKFKGDRNEE